jgi:Domain of unknown function (DUF6468)
MSTMFSVTADILVAVLLAATIITSLRLSRRIAKLKGDEEAMRRTIGELMLASENAERAIAGLRTTLSECERTLGERLVTAERYAADLSAQVEAGQEIITRITQIVGSTKGPAERPAAPAASDNTAEAPAAAQPSASDRLTAAVAAAQALAERAARRREQVAA